MSVLSDVLARGLATPNYALQWTHRKRRAAERGRYAHKARHRA
jgi:hypothetical protein